MRWSAGTRQSRNTISAWLPGRPYSGVGVRHRADVAHDLHARRAGGHDEHRRVPVRAALGVGLGEDQHDVGHRRVGDEPLVARRSPTRRRRASRSCRSRSGRRRRGTARSSANALEISPRRFGQSHRSFCASVAPWASSSMLPLSGACTPKIVIDIMQRPMISDISASLSCPKPAPPSFGSRNAPHRPCALTWSWRCALAPRPTRRRAARRRSARAGSARRR